ncbi:hypothetical protein PIB30_089548 [Stylosanthes scabra]|uniref:Uncharacterized protein n=1 Tax=Stylosanthes scabra TaxID=79078 RepID=A0ABU6WSF2_9FABA|nr:hypothetical protein [Stylosanthes scabra]
MMLELGRTPTQSEVFARTHTRKEDRSWVDKRSEDVNVSLKLCKNSSICFIFTASWSRAPPPPNRQGRGVSTDCGRPQEGKDLWDGCGSLPQIPHLFADPEDGDTASGPPDLREQVTLLNREISQQAEAHAQSLAAVEAVCAEKVRTLESTVQMQSQEVSELRNAYTDIYSFLMQMRSSGSSAVTMPDMPPPPPPPTRSQSPPPPPDQGTGSPQAEDNLDYV